MLKHPDGTREPLAIGAARRPRGRPEAARGVSSSRPRSEPFGEAETSPRTPTLAKGYIGPGALGEKNASGIRYLVDPRVVEGTRWVTGADVPGSHVLDLVAGRDFTADGDDRGRRGARRRPLPGLRARRRRLESARGIEMGHIFQLGRKYADALGLQVLDENGKLVTVTMGSYGIGPSRAVAAIAEGTLDELGLVLAPQRRARPTSTWSPPARTRRSSPPPTGSPPSCRRTASTVLYDDRPKVSPGVKFKDAELIGVPTIVVVGRNLADGTIEVRDRRTGDREEVPTDHVVNHLVPLVRS